ncbi:MAG: amino acid adenylation domain-containing protein [Gammaproteobacteria bacterium]|nr:amino acid adenylation domain-containing protein [Gammaproteobacteria bacterium]MDH5801632.1 amino acid adenylation domain-containing protein [Gammaproteobacteria bacterium]
MEELLVSVARAGIQLEISGNDLCVKAPEGALTDELRQGLRRHKADLLKLLKSESRTEEKLPVLVPDEKTRHEPFPLTDLQHAYWLGRDGFMEMGNVATHLYVELECENLDVQRLNLALNKMIARHDMLRAIVEKNGQQRILQHVEEYQISVNDCSGVGDEAIAESIDEVREALSHQVFVASQWPLFEVRVSQLPQSKSRLHVSLDLLILDAWSIFLFFKEWHQIYQEPGRNDPPFTISFREYVVAEKALLQSPAYHRAQDYWFSRLDSIPAAPQLPMVIDKTSRDKPRFVRRESRLDRETWNNLKKRIRKEGLTPSATLLAAYSEILSRWSQEAHFTLNVTISNRLQMHEEVNHILGDFTSLIMHEVDRRNGDLSFIEFARQQQKLFASDLEHREISGVSVMREWAKRRGLSMQAIMPVVFSSGLIWSGDDEVGNLEQFGRKVYSISQTSQVWLDHHVMELDGELVFVWDAAEDVFQPGVLDSMFSSYCQMVRRLALDDSAWDRVNLTQLPDTMLSVRQEEVANSQVDNMALHAGFVANALSKPDDIALIAPQRTLSYGQLLGESACLAKQLINLGVRPGEPVAVLMRKGWEQIVAVYGILMSGGAYMPVDADLPMRRQLDLLALAKVRYVVTQAGVAKENICRAEFQCIELQAETTETLNDSLIQSLDVETTQLAYIIFTSGTTGVPKGVMIDHYAANNTITEINKLYGVEMQDRVLGVSSLSFDLSVYDIFGSHTAGAALVLPDYSKGHDPAHWADLIQQHRVSVWNSAPQLMHMLLEYHGLDMPAEEHPLLGLRTVLLSGDFIPLNVPERLHAINPSMDVVSLGGATEAAIWSIHYKIEEMDPKWKSIPYGKALPGQKVWVLNQGHQVCPDYVRGRIYIGGAGLALGYWEDENKTNASFKISQTTGERIYDTGDLGYYRPDGNIVIEGRDDGQVKIRGYRIELGEIETVLRRYPAVSQAVVSALSDEKGNKQLVGYIEWQSQLDVIQDDAPMESIKAFLAEYLPEYMIPKQLVSLERIPVTANGKVDYSALPDSFDQAVMARETVGPRNELEQTILNAWGGVISGCELGVTDNFFELGGDSVLATQLVREINETLPGFQLEMHELFENLTIESLAVLYESRREESTYIEQREESDNGFMANKTRLENHVDQLSQSIRKIKLPLTEASTGAPIGGHSVFLTGATGWVGAHVLWELLVKSNSTVYCLVRAENTNIAHKRILDAMSNCHLVLNSEQKSRIRALCGDLSQPLLGMSKAKWDHVCSKVSTIYHLGASVSVLMDYQRHKSVNVDSLSELALLASHTRLKSIRYLSPMAVCRRNINGKLVVLGEERIQDSPDGLLTPYSQSKWAAEMLLNTMIQVGIPVKIYRTSHALPAFNTGSVKPNDTYCEVLSIACNAGAVPDWEDSGVFGVPVDILSSLIVKNAIDEDGFSGVVHLENPEPLSLKSVLQQLMSSTLDESSNNGAQLRLYTLQEWKQKCLDKAGSIGEAQGLHGTSAQGSASVGNMGMVKSLFEERRTGTGVENMFARHHIDVGYLSKSKDVNVIRNMVPAEYWKKMTPLLFKHSSGNQEVNKSVLNSCCDDASQVMQVN